MSLNKFMFFVGFCLVSVLIYAIAYPSIVESRIPLGMSKSEVLSIVSDQHHVQLNDLDYLCVKNNWMGCEEALKYDSSSYIRVSVGIDTLLVIGFDKSLEVIFTVVGDT